MNHPQEWNPKYVSLYSGVALYKQDLKITAEGLFDGGPHILTLGRLGFTALTVECALYGRAGCDRYENLADSCKTNLMDRPHYSVLIQFFNHRH